MQRIITAFALCLAVSGCKRSAAGDCEQAKQIYLDHARKKQAEGIATVADAGDRAKLEQEGNAELQRADARFIDVCKELGEAKVLACMKKARALDEAKDPDASDKLRSDADCASLVGLPQRLYGP